jgi:hypothetical protein
VSPAQLSAVRAIFWAGFLCGCMDITAALTVYGYFGARPLRLLQGIAAGLLGQRTFRGGVATAALGLLCHFVIAFGAAAVYYAASRALPFLIEYALLCGPLYGIGVYFFMQRVVLPLSSAVRYPFSVKMMLIGIVIHIICVGTPIALTIKRFS